MSLRGRIVTVPLEVYRRGSDEYIKTTQLQVKIKNGKVDGETSYSLLCACQEGMYGADLSPVKVKRSKTKRDLDEKEWIRLFRRLFDEDWASVNADQESSLSIEVAAHLHSSETYDKNGELDGDLADEPPDLTILVRSKGTLSVEYGSFKAQVVESENASQDERKELDILNWISLQSEQMSTLSSRVQNLEKKLKETEDLASSREQEIRQITDDYSIIMRDLEDRAFQVINAKRRRILELSGSQSDELKLLNQKFEDANRNNLDRVRIEEIIKGKDFETFEEREKAKQSSKRAKARKAPAKKAVGGGAKKARKIVKSEPESDESSDGMQVDEKEDIKHESETSVGESDKEVEVKEEEKDGVSDEESQEGEYADDSEEHVDDEDEGGEHESDATEYSEEDTQVKREEKSSQVESGDESENGTGNVSQSGPEEEDENNDDEKDEGETDYSD